MLKKKNLYFISFLLLSNPLFAMNELPIPENDLLQPDALYLVHTTSILLENNTAIAGACNRDPSTLKRVILPLEKRIEYRQTLHHTLGGMVPDNYMVTLFNNLSMEPIEKCSSYSYAYLDKFNTFKDKDEIYGGTAIDIFTTSHTYEETSILIIPIHKEEIFYKKNPTFKGTLEKYDDKEISLKEKILMLLEQKNASILDIKWDNTIYPSLLEIRNKNKIIDTSIFDTFFKNNNLYRGIHANSPFMALENALKPFGRIFEVLECFPADHDKLLLYSIPDKYLNFRITEVKKAFSEIKLHLNPFQLKKIETWEENCWSFIKLHELEYELHHSQHSLFIKKDKFLLYIDQRKNLSLDQLKIDAFDLINESNTYDFYKTNSWEEFQKTLIFNDSDLRHKEIMLQRKERICALIEEWHH